jgi:hypothetical protein
MSIQAIAVPFHGTDLFVVEVNGQPYTPMKPIVEGMGLDWKSQHVKLTGNSRFCMVEITIQLPGDKQRRAVACMPLRKLAGWLMTISPNKVKPELREKVIQYQNECDDALWDYWTKGQATRPQPGPVDLPDTPIRSRVLLLIENGQVIDSKVLPIDAVVISGLGVAALRQGIVEDNTRALARLTAFCEEASAGYLSPKTPGNN